MDCPKCNNPATFGPNEGFYGTRYVSSAGSYMAWYCKRCSTYVGTHHNDPAKPLGTMADAETREWRARAHRVIDPIWQSGRMGRRTLYSKLAVALGREVHVGGADIELCKSIIFAANHLPKKHGPSHP